MSSTASARRSRAARPVRSEAPIPSAQSVGDHHVQVRVVDRCLREQHRGLVGRGTEDDAHPPAAALLETPHGRGQPGDTVLAHHERLGPAHPPPRARRQQQPVDGDHPATLPDRPGGVGASWAEHPVDRVFRPFVVVATVTNGQERPPSQAPNACSYMAASSSL